MQSDLTSWPGANGGPILRVGRDPASVGRVLASRFIDTLAFRLKDEWVSSAHVVLCGGGLAEEMIAELADSPKRSAVDWDKVHVWWSDERFLVDGHVGRHATKARSAGLLRAGVREDRMHVVPPAFSDKDMNVGRVTDEYATLLRKYAPFGRRAPVFDIVLLDVGEDGEVGALYPGEPSLSVTASATAITNAPFPPLERTTMTFAVINEAARVWLLADGPGPAEAVAQAVTGAHPSRVPAAGAHGVLETIWWLDEEAARSVPEELRRPIAQPAAD